MYIVTVTGEYAGSILHLRQTRQDFPSVICFKKKKSISLD